MIKVALILLAEIFLAVMLFHKKRKIKIYSFVLFLLTVITICIARYFEIGVIFLFRDLLPVLLTQLFLTAGYYILLYFEKKSR